MGPFDEYAINYDSVFAWLKEHGMPTKQERVAAGPEAKEVSPS